MRRWNLCALNRDGASVFVHWHNPDLRHPCRVDLSTVTLPTFGCKADHFLAFAERVVGHLGGLQHRADIVAVYFDVRGVPDHDARR